MTEQPIPQTGSELPPTSPSTVTAAPPDVTLRPAAVMDTEDNSDSENSENQLKKIRIVLDVNGGSNLTDSSDIVNTEDDKIKLEQ